MREQRGNCIHCKHEIAYEPLSGLYIHSEDGVVYCWDATTNKWSENVAEPSETYEKEGTKQMKTYKQNYCFTFEVEADSIEKAEELLAEEARNELGWGLAKHSGGDVEEVEQ